MNYIETARLIRAEIDKKREESKGFLQNISIPVKEGSNSKPSYEINELNEINPIHLEEATRLYRKRGWVQVYSTYLKANIYLVRNKAIHVPDPSILRYAEAEIDALRDLSLEELKTLHEAKIIFKGVINERREHSTEQSAFPVWR